MLSSDADSQPEDLDATEPAQSTPRPGAPSSHPSASQYAAELPYPEELQQMLGGGYVVESFLGQGGMGAVYRGLQLPLMRPVAVKILRKQGDASEDEFAFEERFKREAYAMAALTHPNIRPPLTPSDPRPGPSRSASRKSKFLAASQIPSSNRNDLASRH